MIRSGSKTKANTARSQETLHTVLKAVQSIATLAVELQPKSDGNFLNWGGYETLDEGMLCDIIDALDDITHDVKLAQDACHAHLNKLEHGGT